MSQKYRSTKAAMATGAALDDQYFWIMATAIVAGGLTVIFWKTRSGK